MCSASIYNRAPSNNRLHATGTPAREPGVMFMKRKIRKHLSAVDNVAIYLLVAAIFFYELFDEGLKSAVRLAAVLGYLWAAWFVVAYVAGLIRARKFSMAIGDVIALLYFAGFFAYWIAEIGFNKKAIILALPIFTGIVLVSAFWIGKTDAYGKLHKWEKGFYQRMFSVFRKKT